MPMWVHRPALGNLGTPRDWSRWRTCTGVNTTKTRLFTDNIFIPKRTRLHNREARKQTDETRLTPKSTRTSPEEIRPRTKNPCPYTAGTQGTRSVPLRPSNNPRANSLPRLRRETPRMETTGLGETTKSEGMKPRPPINAESIE